MKIREMSYLSFFLLAGLVIIQKVDAIKSLSWTSLVMLGLILTFVIYMTKEYLLEVIT